jgi:hypothetical protein
MKSKEVERGLVDFQIVLKYAPGVGGVERPLEQPVHQALGAAREPQLALAGGLLDVGTPLAQLCVSELVDVGSLRQVGQCLLVGDHDVGRLHPGHVELVPAAQLAELDVGRVDAAVAQLLHHVVGRVERVGDGGEIAMQTAQQAGVDAAGLGLGLDPSDPRPRLVDDVFDRLGEALEDDLADFLGLLDRPQLVREEDHVGACHAGQRSGSDQRQAQ